MKEEYRVTAEVGDIVRMPCGIQAVVTGAQIIWGGHVRELTLSPRTNVLYHAWLFLCGRLRPCEYEINKLVKVGSVTTA